MLAVEVLEKRDGVLPGDARQLLEGGDGNAVALCFLVSGELLFQLSQRLAMKNKLGRDAHEVFLPQEDLQKFLGSLGLNGELCEHFLYPWYCQTRLSKCRFDLVLGLDC